MLTDYQCECADPGCPCCAGTHRNAREEWTNHAIATMHLFRIDMEDESGVYFCDYCGEDALDSGVFRTEDD